MSRPALLHNMSMRPRTHIAWRIEPETTVACFDLAVVAEAVGSLLDTRCTDRGSAIRAIQTDPQWLRDTLATQLEGARRPIHLRGAVLVFPCRATSRRAGAADHRAKEPRVYASDPLLVLNVLGRAASHLLLPSAPLSRDWAHLERCLGTVDPRLVALVCPGEGVTP